MKIVPLTRGLVARVSEEDYEALLQSRWHAKPAKSARETYYAMAHIGGRKVYMHRLIMGAEPGQIVDHIDGDGLNNARENLRFATLSSNCVNRSRMLNRHGFRGVQYQASRGRYIATIRAKECRWTGPRRVTAIEAAIDYDRKAVALWGEFARPNFPCLTKALAKARGAA